MGIIKQDSSSKNSSHTLLSIKAQVTAGSCLIPLLWQDGLWMHLRIQLRVILGLGSCLSTVSSFWTIFHPVIVFVASHSIVTNNLGCCQHHSDLLFFLPILFIICSFSPVSYKNLVILLLFLLSLLPFSFLSLSLSLFLSHMLFVCSGVMLVMQRLFWLNRIIKYMSYHV